MDLSSSFDDVKCCVDYIVIPDGSTMTCPRLSDCLRSIKSCGKNIDIWKIIISYFDCCPYCSACPFHHFNENEHVDCKRFFNWDVDNYYNTNAEDEWYTSLYKFNYQQLRFDKFLVEDYCVSDINLWDQKSVYTMAKELEMNQKKADDLSEALLFYIFLGGKYPYSEFVKIWIKNGDYMTNSQIINLVEQSKVYNKNKRKRKCSDIIMLSNYNYLKQMRCDVRKFVQIYKGHLPLISYSHI